MSDQNNIDPRRVDPGHPDGPRVAPRSPYTDPAADPRIVNETVVHNRNGRGGLIAAGVIAVLLVIALIAFSSGPGTDAGTTAVIPEQTEQTTEPAPAPAPEAAPAEDTAPAAPVEEEAPAAPADEQPAPNQ
ncbi:MAG: hypothetical protein KL840_18815 [Aquamicrobium sp.]|nr:hypothetical protein [Aquamicrobium sp.]